MDTKPHVLTGRRIIMWDMTDMPDMHYAGYDGQGMLVTSLHHGRADLDEVGLATVSDY